MSETDSTTRCTHPSADDGDGSAADPDNPAERAEPPPSVTGSAIPAPLDCIEVLRLPGGGAKQVNIDLAWVRSRLASAMAHVDKPVEQITVTIVGDEKMCSLNEAHRGVRDTTDVLAFERRADDDAIEADIVICADEAARRAAEFAHSIEQELLLYALHGVLHCSGFDDHTNDDFEAMHVEEDRILTAIGVGPTFARDASGHADRRTGRVRAGKRARD
jgi:probable rRNA maturation factor